MRRLSLIAVFPVFLAACVPPAGAQLTDILLGPKTLIDRAIEARSSSDIARDNAIVIDVNKYMAENETIRASTDIYEQNLLVTGMFNDLNTYRTFETQVRALKDVKKLYWHVTYMSEAEEKKAKESGKLMDWADALVFEQKAHGRLIGTAGVADVNFRVTADAYGNLYLLGRARSREELNKAIDRLKDGDGVKQVFNYAFVRP